MCFICFKIDLCWFKHILFAYSLFHLPLLPLYSFPFFRHAHILLFCFLTHTLLRAYSCSPFIFSRVFSVYRKDKAQNAQAQAGVINAWFSGWFVSSKSSSSFAAYFENPFIFTIFMECHKRAKIWAKKPPKIPIDIGGEEIFVRIYVYSKISGKDITWIWHCYSIAEKSEV